MCRHLLSKLLIVSAFHLGLIDCHDGHPTTTTCQADCGSDNTNDAAPIVPFPQMPKKIHAILRQDWNEMDVRGNEMITALSHVRGAVEFAHARSPFFEHLKGTFGILAAWNQPDVVKRTGLMHTAYSGDLFQFYLFDSTSPQDRDVVASILGEEAESLTYKFGTANRDALFNFGGAVNRTAPGVHKPMEVEGPQEVKHRILGRYNVSASDAANILMITIADYLDQMVEVIGWREHHMIESPEMLFPGDGRPAVAMYWFSSICKVIKPHLEVVPPIFNDCTVELEYADERTARDDYWNVIINEAIMSEDEQMFLLERAATLNPFVAEPHIMLSQIHFRRRRYGGAAHHAAKALEKMYVLASAWDKRRSFETWVGFARIMLLRSNRKMQNKASFPFNLDLPPTAKNLPLVNIHDILNEMNDTCT